MGKDTLERLNGMFASYSGMAAEALAARDTDSEYEGQDANEWLDSWPLEIKRPIIVRIVLATGGPHVEIVCDCDNNGGMLELDSAALETSWGSDHVSRVIPEGSPLWQLASYYIEALEA